MKLIIYQVLTRLWGNGRFSAFDTTYLEYLKSFGIDCIWLTGIPQHASGKDFVKGDPGCPYAISDWKDINPYLADNPDARTSEFSALVSRAHACGLKVCTDYIPNHVAKDYSGPIPHHDWYDGDWSDTLKVDWSDERTIPEMVSVLKFWAALGVDAFRCDMVELVPAESLGKVVREVRKSYPDLLFIGEVYDKSNYDKYLNTANLSLLYDKSGVYDALREIKTSGVSAEILTWNWQSLGEMQPRMLNFLENHDEQRLMHWTLSDPYWPAVAFSILFNTSSFMLYFGQEIGESAPESSDGRTSIFNWCKPEGIRSLYEFVTYGKALDPKSSEILRRYGELLGYAGRDAFSAGSVWDLCYCQNGADGFNRKCHFAFARFNDSESYIVFCNFSDTKAIVSLRIPPELKDMFGCDTVEINAEASDYLIQSFSE